MGTRAVPPVRKRTQISWMLDAVRVLEFVRSTDVTHAQEVLVTGCKFRSYQSVINTDCTVKWLAR